MNTGPDFDPWHLNSADLIVYLLHFGNHFARVARYSSGNLPTKTSRDVNKVCLKKVQDSNLTQEILFKNLIENVIASLFLNSNHSQTLQNYYDGFCSSTDKSARKTFQDFTVDTKKIFVIVEFDSRNKIS